MANPPLDREVTPEELYSNPQWDPCELINGKVVRKTYAGHLHGEIGARLICLLYPVLSTAGKIYSAGTGFISPDGRSVLAPDAMFISAARIPPHLSRRGYLPVPPDFAVEVLDANEGVESLSAKVDFYLTTGVRLVWVVCIRTRRLHVYRVGMGEEILTENDLVCTEPVLSELKFSVAELFTD